MTDRGQGGYRLPRGLFGTEYAWRPAWGFLARQYVRLFGLVDFPGRLRARIMLKHLAFLQPGKVLDLGSGTGCYAFYLSRLPELELSAVDIDPARIADSRLIVDRLRRPNVRFTLGNQEAPLREFKSNSFDMVLAIEVLQYVPDVAAALRDIYRVLRPGGHVIGHVPMLGTLRPTETMLFDDGSIRSLLTGAHLRIAKIQPTFGGVARRLCNAYTFISRWPMLVELLFPFFLGCSAALPIEALQGDYRLFIAQKPFAETEMETGPGEAGRR